MSNFEIKFETPAQRELSETPRDQMVLTPWTVQNIVYEMLQDHLMKNDPQKIGYTFEDKYNPDDTKSDITLAIGHDWKGNIAGKRPAYFIFREDMQYTRYTINQLTDIDPINSQKTKLYTRSMSCNIACIGKDVGYAEQLAEYAEIPFITFEEEIRREFKFRRFKVTGITKPQQYKEAVDNFIIVIMIEVVFDRGYIIRRDDLKIKTFSRTIFDACSPRVPLTLQ